MSMTPEVFEQEKKVEGDDLDQNQHVNNVRYVQWIQDVAKAHWEKRAGSELREKYFWVVIRHEIDYKNQAFKDDELLLQTFVGKHTHVTSVRHVNIINKNSNETLVKAKSTWCLMDGESKKPVKITEEMLKIFTR